MMHVSNASSSNINSLLLIVARSFASNHLAAGQKEVESGIGSEDAAAFSPTLMMLCLGSNRTWDSNYLESVDVHLITCPS